MIRFIGFLMAAGMAWHGQAWGWLAAAIVLYLLTSGVGLAFGTGAVAALFPAHKRETIGPKIGTAFVGLRWIANIYFFLGFIQFVTMAFFVLRG